MKTSLLCKTAIVFISFFVILSMENIKATVDIKKIEQEHFIKLLKRQKRPKQENLPTISTNIANQSSLETQINLQYENYLTLLDILKPEEKTKTKTNTKSVALLSAAIAIASGVILEKAVEQTSYKNYFPVMSYMIGIPVYILSYYFSQKYLSNIINVTYTNLVKSIIKNWSIYKYYIPEEFYEKFQPFLDIYAKDQKLEITESQACTLLIDLISSLKLKIKNLEELRKLNLR